MLFREATPADIQQIQIVRNAVKENTLSDPALVSDNDCLEYITQRGKGWVCEIESRIVGFSIVDLKENNVWALFVHPDAEGLGIGRKLQELMLNWYFSQTQQTLWLGTAPGTRAEGFYRKSGWKETGLHGRNEIKFEMSFALWNSR
jgi:GNAT superfamily N-acetyltransferase